MLVRPVLRHNKAALGSNDIASSSQKTSPYQDPAVWYPLVTEVSVPVSMSAYHQSSLTIDPVDQLLGLRQGHRSIEDYVQQFCELVYQVPLYDEILFKDLFCFGLNEPVKSRLPGGEINVRLSVFMDYALKLCDSPFTVGATEEERDAALTHEMTAAPEHAHKMAATTESGRKMAVTTTPRQVTADRHESSQVTANLPETHNRPAKPGSVLVMPAKPGPARVMSATPESPAKMATTPADAPLWPGLIACVLDVPLVSVRAAGIPRAAALTVPESLHVSADLPESLHVSADLPESLHVSADLPESLHVSADLPESLHVSADLPESAPEPAPSQELAESAPEPAPAESAPEHALSQELAESAPEPGSPEPLLVPSGSPEPLLVPSGSPEPLSHLLLPGGLQSRLRHPGGLRSRLRRPGGLRSRLHRPGGLRSRLPHMDLALRLLLRSTTLLDCCMCGASGSRSLGGALSRIWLPFHHMDSCTTLQLHITPPQTTTLQSLVLAMQTFLSVIPVLNFLLPTWTVSPFMRELCLPNLTLPALLICSVICLPPALISSLNSVFDSVLPPWYLTPGIDLCL